MLSINSMAYILPKRKKKKKRRKKKQTTRKETQRKLSFLVSRNIDDICC